MSTIYLRYLYVLLLVVFCATHLVYAQVTFSKGWGPGGKRAVHNEPDYRVNAKLALIFHNLLSELKRSMVCDHQQPAVNYLQAAIGEH